MFWRRPQTTISPKRARRRLPLAGLAALIALTTACQPLLTTPPTEQPLPVAIPDQTAPAAVAATGEETGPASIPTGAHSDQAPAAGEQVWRLWSCQSCHGTHAEGDRGPSLRGTWLTAAAFLARVRSGGTGMRGFSQEEIGDQELRELHAWLQALPVAPPVTVPNALGITVPPAVRVEQVADRLPGLTALALAPDGALTAATEAGQVWQLVDSDGDGTAESRSLLADGLRRPTALLWLRQDSGDPLLLIADRGGVHGLMPGADDPTPLLGKLPGGAAVQANGLALGTDGLLYVTQGTAMNGAPPREGAVWRFRLPALLAGAGEAELFAGGMRNPTGIVFSPSGAVYVVENGLGWPENAEVPEELNVLLGGGDYGWPAVWGQPPPESGTIGPMVQFPAGSQVNGLLFLRGDMLEEYATDLLVAAAGAVLRVEIVSDVTGYTGFVHEFAGGLQQPVALVQDPAGAILIADREAGAVYRLFR